MAVAHRPKDHAAHIQGTFPIEFVYTAGIAGERFLREMKENGSIYGVRCRECDLVYLPPRLYCERCFGRLEDWVEVGCEGRVRTYTILYFDSDGNRLPSPEVVALIEFEGVYGGIIHRLGEVDPSHVSIGMPVRAVLKEKPLRTGSITDIRYFKPVRHPPAPKGVRASAPNGS